MNLISYYKVLRKGQTSMSEVGIGAGHWRTNTLGNRLPSMLSDNVAFISREHGISMKDITDYPIREGDFDIAYCDTFESPVGRRPAPFIYGWLHDYIDLEKECEDYLRKTRPNLLLSLLYHKDDLMALCQKYDCHCVYMTYFVNEAKAWNPYRSIQAMCSGAWGYPVYPWRTRVARYLQNMNRTNIVLSMTHNQIAYPLKCYDYHKMLYRTRYYFSGGIFDWQIPAKYFEVCNYGATLVSPELPKMRELGFIDGETYIKIDDLGQIPSIIASDRWQVIGPQGQKMIQQRHMIHHRVDEIKALYQEWSHHEDAERI